MSLFRSILALLFLGFAGASFLFGMEMKRKYWEQDRQLWQSRRDNRGLRNVVVAAGEENAWLDQRMAALRGELDDRDGRIAELESAMRDLELDLAIARIDRDDVRSENLRLAASVENLEGEVESLSAEVVRLHLVSTGKDWLAGLREAGSRLAVAMADRDASRPRRTPQVEPVARIHVAATRAPSVPMAAAATPVLDPAVSLESMHYRGIPLFGLPVPSGSAGGAVKDGPIQGAAPRMPVLLQMLRSLLGDRRPWLQGVTSVLQGISNVRCLVPRSRPF